MADPDQARWLELGLKARFGALSALRYRVVAGRNQGATVDLLAATRRTMQES